MLHIEAKTATDNLKIRRSMARLFQSYIYTLLPSKEHDGYIHQESGKRFKSTNFRIMYHDNIFTIFFTALNSEYEQLVAMDILKNGLKLGEVKISETKVSINSTELPKSIKELQVRGYVVASIKNRLTNRKIFLEPSDPRHKDIIEKNALQKYEAIFQKPYIGDLSIEALWQSPRESHFWYEKSRYIAWKAQYNIKASYDMINLLVKTGMGSDTMKNLGFLEVV